MPRLPKTLLALTAAGLLAVPVGVTAAADAAPLTGSSSPSAAAAVQRDTWIRYLDFDRVKRYGSTTKIRGQVGVRTADGPRAARGLDVLLYRRVDGSDSWRLLGSDRTGYDLGMFSFSVPSIANATYRVVYRGGPLLDRSRDAVRVLVYRPVSSQLADPSGVFSGRVTPRYAHRKVTLERRTCGSCSWQPLRSRTTGDYGRFRFEVGAPSAGRWFWRVSVPASTRFMRSYSGVYTTQLN